MTEQRTVPPTEDPVCGMTVDPAERATRGSPTPTTAPSTPSAAGAACWSFAKTQPSS